MGFNEKILRLEKIAAICEERDSTYTSTRKDVLKFCRPCIKQVTTKLSELINFEAQCCKKYRQELAAPENKDDQKLSSSLRETLTESYSKYQRFHGLYQRLANAKLLTTECAVCRHVLENT